MVLCFRARCGVVPVRHSLSPATPSPPSGAPVCRAMKCTRCGPGAAGCSNPSGYSPYPNPSHGPAQPPTTSTLSPRLTGRDSKRSPLETTRTRHSPSSFARAQTRRGYYGNSDYPLTCAHVGCRCGFVSDQSRSLRSQSLTARQPASFRSPSHHDLHRTSCLFGEKLGLADPRYPPRPSSAPITPNRSARRAVSLRLLQSRHHSRHPRAQPFQCLLVTPTQPWRKWAVFSASR